MPWCFSLFLNITITDNSTRFLACNVMVVVGYICITKKWDIPFLYFNSGRGYASFFMGTLLHEFQEKIGKRKREKISGSALAFLIFVTILSAINGVEPTFGDFYRCFVFIIAPTIIISTLNLNFVRAFFELRPFVWLGSISMSIYYVHNNVMVDYTIINEILNLKLNFNSTKAFVIIIVSMIPFAVLWGKIAGTWGNSIKNYILNWFNS